MTRRAVSSRGSTTGLQLAADLVALSPGICERTELGGNGPRDVRAPRDDRFQGPLDLLALTGELRVLLRAGACTLRLSVGFALDIGEGRLRLLQSIRCLLYGDCGRRQRLLGRAEASVERCQFHGSVRAPWAAEEDGHDLLGLLTSLAKRPPCLTPLAELSWQCPQLALAPGDLACDFGDESFAAPTSRSATSRPAAAASVRA